MTTITIKQFYEDFFGASCPDLNLILSENINKDIGHFNVFDIAEMYTSCPSKPEMPYNRRTYYKISLISGQNKVEFADKTITIKDCGILFASPKIPYNYTPSDHEQAGHFCVFTKDFLAKSKIGLEIDAFPIFSQQSDFIYPITSEQFDPINVIFQKMHTEIAGTGYYASIEETTEEGFDEMSTTHLKAPFFLTQKVLPLLNEGASIVNTSSGLARFSHPNWAAYAIMKAGIDSLTRYQALEFGPKKIRVNSIAPGAIATDFGGGAVRDNKEINDTLAAATALGRVGLPDDIGSVIVFLCSDDSKWINAQRIEVSGGVPI
nr:SDR family oxidoreductase [uncultured Flavobacterium sp.]